jgi:hypothetical protein
LKKNKDDGFTLQIKRLSKSVRNNSLGTKIGKKKNSETAQNFWKLIPSYLVFWF